MILQDYCGFHIESGVLALYQAIVTTSVGIPTHNSTFRNCGANTQSGSNELRQIPSAWK